MNKEIMRFSNKCVYAEEMRCANKNVEEGRMNILEFNKQAPELLSWIFDPLSPVVFLDLGRQLKSQSDFDCRITASIVKYLIALQCQPKDIGVITPLRKARFALDASLEVYIS